MRTPRFPALLDALMENRTITNLPTLLSYHLYCLDLTALKHVPSALVPCLRPSHWLAFLPGLVGQTVLKGLPSVHPQVAPPAGLLQCWPEHLSLPESNVLGGKDSIDKEDSWIVIINVNININKANKTYLL